ncbi:hypothetical protein BS47DRAFT_214529 [Hydnum rufescens UP504]|uniref:Uncharacterized protein n=1 Tax=Hydnum rufescens UP504 TaxID=1448309 RepID=A0A9P6DRL7_9AGAM|nr:hypothetical protein BS47DRAFT_214529 [Hydnum rufescens UP504]
MRGICWCPPRIQGRCEQFPGFFAVNSRFVSHDEHLVLSQDSRILQLGVVCGIVRRPECRSATHLAMFDIFRASWWTRNWCDNINGICRYHVLNANRRSKGVLAERQR